MRDLTDKWMFLATLMLGKTGECVTVQNVRGVVSPPSEHCWFYGHICEEGGSLFPRWSNIYTWNYTLKESYW